MLVSVVVVVIVRTVVLVVVVGKYLDDESGPTSRRSCGRAHLRNVDKVLLGRIVATSICSSTSHVGSTVRIRI